MRTGVITFSGIDSSGKSTQIEILRNRLRKKGYRTETVWSRGGYTGIMQAIKDFIRIIKRNALPDPSDTRGHEEQFKKGPITRLWLFLSILDLMRLYAVQLRLMNFLGIVVIMDRYINDTEIDFQMKFINIDLNRIMLWRFFKKTAVKPDAGFLIEIPVDESLRRSELKDEPFPEDEVRRRARHLHYVNLKKKHAWQYVINGMGTVDEINNEIKGHLSI